jgi:hypothetical protein
MTFTTWSRRRGQTSTMTLWGLGWVAILVVALAALAAACTPTSVSTTSPSPVSSDSGSAGPKPTRWPTTTIEAAIALGAAHGDFTKMVNDIAAAVASEDPARIATAMDDALAFLTGNQTNIPKLQAYDSTKPVGDRLAAVYDKMIEGVTLVRDGLRTGDGDAVERGFTLFFEGNTEYLDVAPDLVDLAEQAVLMKRILLQ